MNTQFKRTLINAATMAAIAAIMSGCGGGGGGGDDNPPPPANKADLALAMSATPNPVTVNDVLTYTTTVTNQGPSGASNVNFKYTLPAATSEIVAADCNVNGQTVDCNIGALASGGSATRTMTLKPTATGSLTTTAQVSGSETDPDTANNNASATITVQPEAPPPTKQADIGVRLTADPSGSVQENDPVFYTLAVSNSGPDLATDVQLVSDLNITSGAISTTATGCTIEPNQAAASPVKVTCAIGNLTVGGTPRNITIRAVPSAISGNTATLNHVAKVSAAETDSNLSNNQNSSKLTVSKPAQLSISGQPDPSAYVGIGYQFKPDITKLNETDVLTFTIENKPDWLAFDKRNGEITGFPAEDDIKFYDDLSITVTDGQQTRTLGPFDIEVKTWQGFGYCSGMNLDGKTECGPISNYYVVKPQCQSWADGQSIKNPVLHTNDRLDVLEAEAKSICSNQPVSGNQCPPGMVEVPQDIKTPAIACMDDLSIEELTQKAQEEVTKELEDYLTTAEQDALPDFKPLEPEILGPDANGHYTVVLPPPVAQQNELEKQRRWQDFGEIMNYLTDCSRLVEEGSFWNKAVCYSWQRPFGDSQIGATLNAMAYMKVSGEAAASANVIGHLLGFSQPLISLFGKTQVYTLPENYVNGLNMADAVIKVVESKNPEETLQTTLKNSPELQAGIAQVRQELIDAVKEAEKTFNKAKAEVEAAISKTKAEIEKAKAKFQEAKAQLDSAVADFNQAKTDAERNLQSTLQSFQAKKSEIAGSLEMLEPDPFLGFKLTAIWQSPSPPIEAENGQPLSFVAAPFKDSIEIFHASQQFTIVVVPVNLQETILAKPTLLFNASIVDPLQANARVMLGIDPRVELKAKAQAGVGIEFASAGVAGTVKVIDSKLGFNLIATAAEFPEPPLVVVDWQADVLDGRIALYAELKVTVMKVVQQYAQKVISWASKKLGINPIQVPEIQIKRYEHELFRFTGFHIPENQKCNNPEYQNRAILYCSRPNKCYVDTCENENKRFVDQGNGTIKDLKTSLVWNQTVISGYSPSPSVVCEEGGECGIVGSNYCDGIAARYPTVAELQTLVTDTANQIGWYIQPLFLFDQVPFERTMVMTDESCGEYCRRAYDFVNRQPTQTGPNNDTRGGAPVGLLCVK
jgi:uncharacterized repeat protein (TIGR01451 family)